MRPGSPTTTANSTTMSGATSGWWWTTSRVVHRSRKRCSTASWPRSLSRTTEPLGKRGNVCRPACVDAIVRLSVLDLVPVRTDQTTGDALAATLQLAQAADRLGFTRYWVAVHHNMPSVSATSPPVLIAYLIAQTSRVRLGSGGVMLPNHAPLA